MSKVSEWVSAGNIENAGRWLNAAWTERRCVAMCQQADLIEKPSE